MSEPALADVMRTLRVTRSITQLQLAFAMGASSTKYLSALETGRSLNPSRTFLRRYVAAFVACGVPITPAEQVDFFAAVCALPQTA